MALTNARLQSLSKFPGEKTPIRPVKNRKAIPELTKSFLSNPRAPTTTNPRLQSIRLPSPSARHDLTFPALEDRGSMVTVLGVRQFMSNGKPGGTPNLIAPNLNGMQDKPITASSTLRAQIEAHLVKEQVRTQRNNARKKNGVARIRPGLSALDVARQVRKVPDTPSGARGVLRDIPKKLTGRFAQHLRAPVSALAVLVKDRKLNISYGLKGETEQPATIAMVRTSAIATELNPQRQDTRDDVEVKDVGTPAINWLFLASVAVIGFMILKR